VISRHKSSVVRTWVVVHHNCFKSILSESANSANGAPIELNGRSNAVDARAKDHHTIVVEIDVTLGRIVRRVEVI
jgi:hypothetical protein